MENIRDWCISRQLWWGHRIPAWYCLDCDRGAIRGEAPRASSCREHATRSSRAPTRPSVRAATTNLIRDSDVLDTWFSSALWPFSTMGWPEKTATLARFYPTSALVTGFDIIFFWVARMMMMGLHFMDDVPFRDVYVHALVRDEHGQKMSKSKGNVIDPLELLDRYGTDALRFTLVALSAMGRDIKLSEDRIEGYRNFANKIWNAARFVLMNAAGEQTVPSDLPLPADDLTLADRWILHRFAVVSAEVRAALERLSLQRGGVGALPLPLVGLLRLVSRDGEDLARRAGASLDHARRAGRRARALSALASPVHAVPHRGALAGASRAEE